MTCSENTLMTYKASRPILAKLGTIHFSEGDAKRRSEEPFYSQRGDVDYFFFFFTNVLV